MPRTIRKYGNRKLYDMEEKRYVSLKRLGELAREGEDFQVIEKETGNDVTSEVLAKVVASEEKGKASHYSQTFLQSLLRRGGELVGNKVEQVEEGLDHLVGYSLQRLQPFREYRQEVEKLSKRLQELEKAVDDLSGRIQKS